MIGYIRRYDSFRILPGPCTQRHPRTLPIGTATRPLRSQRRRHRRRAGRMLLHLPTAPGERLAMFIQRRPRPRDLLAFHFRVASAPAGRYEQPPAEPLARLWSTTAGPIQVRLNRVAAGRQHFAGAPANSCPAAAAMPVRATSSRGDEKPIL